MPNLFMINLGGKAKGTNIEIHDILFVIADNIEETYSMLIENWFGVIDGLHIDSYKKIKGIDGYRISIVEEEQIDYNNLYFVYMGGYNKNLTTELHEVGLFICDTEHSAKKQASNTLLTDALEKHVDTIVNVGLNMMSINNYEYFIKFEKSEEIFDMKPDWFGYNRLDQKKNIANKSEEWIDDKDYLEEYPFPRWG